MTNTIDNMLVFKDREVDGVTLGNLPDPDELDFETLDVCHATMLLSDINGEIFENEAAADRFDAWWERFNAEWERRSFLEEQNENGSRDTV
jgi:hypothetical protein